MPLPFERFFRSLRHFLSKASFKKELQWEFLSYFLPPLHDLKGSRIVEYAWVLRNLGLEEGTILDIGCGYSKFPILLSSLGYEVFAIDLRDYPIHGHRNFTFVKGDIRSQNPKLPHHAFDRILCISTLEHIEDHDGDVEAINKMKKLLKEGGKILLTVPFGSQYLEAPRDRRYDAKRLKMVLTGFLIERMDFFTLINGFFEPTSDRENATLVCLKVSLKPD